MSKTGWLGLPLGVTFNKTSKIFARMQSWKKPEGAILHAWMDSSWFTNMFEVTGSELKAGNLSFEDPDMAGFPKGGWQGGRNWRTGSTPATPNGGLAGDSSVSPMIVENLAEELDAENEFYFDKATRVLSVKPNASMAWPPKVLVATKLQTLVKLSGSKAAPVTGVSIRNIGIHNLDLTFPTAM